MGNGKRNHVSVNIPDNGKKRVVIVGGGFGGLRLMRNLNPRYFQTVLIDRNNYHSFQPLLYQVATAALEPDSVVGPLRKIIKRRPDTYFRLLEAERVDPENKILHTSAGQLKFDILVLATGAKTNFFGNDDFARHAFPMKRITQALDLRSHLFEQFEKAEIVTDANEKQRLMTFVVVGGGPTGVELCGALAELKNKVLPNDYPDLAVRDMRICLVEGHNRVLPGMSDASGRCAHNYLEKMGIELILETHTTAYNGRTVTLNNGEKIEADTLIWAAGVQGAIVEGFGDGSIEKNSILVDESNHVYRDVENGQTYSDLYAIGDVAYMRHPDYPKGLPGLAQVAMQQGERLAHNLNHAQEGHAMKPFHYTDKGVMATIGRNKAVADLRGGLRLKGLLGWLTWMLIHLLFLIGFRNKAVVFANWAWNYFTYDRGIRLILRSSRREDESAARDLITEIEAESAADD